MTPDLSRRIGRAFTYGAATPTERELLITAAVQPGVDTADDLPTKAHSLLLALEQRAQS